ncbi:TPA: replicative DNA helicase, partial [Mannheimia haemolytica]|nr:replicative DNA helicase [Mannheimia haemolytica]
MAEYSGTTQEKMKDKQVEQINISPHSIEAEQAVLGGIMLSNDHWDNVAERVQPHDFYNYAHRIIFEQMAELVRHNKPIDIITLDQALKDKGVLQDVGGFAYLAELSKNTPSAANILAYADIVRDRSDLRSVISAGNQIAEMGYKTKGRNSKEVLDEAERIVFEIAEKRNNANEGPQRIDDILLKTLARMDSLSKNRHNGGVTGVSTGFVDLNKKTAGLQPSDLIIVAARPSMGKTTFAMNLCENASLVDIE